MNSKLNQIKIEILSGLTVAIALVPEAVAFAFVAHVNPLVGLYAAFIMCFITSVFGGRPGMISGATGAMAVVMVSLVVSHGVEYLFAAVVLTGILQIIFGIFRLGKFIRIVPYPVMLGFVNGLAIVVFMAQLEHFKTVDIMGNSIWLSGNDLYTMLGLVLATVGMVYILPKITKIIPAALGSILIIFGLTQVFDISTVNVGDMASIAGGFPSFHIPNVPFDLETLKVILPYSIILGMVGLIESLLTMRLIDEITETHGSNVMECLAQGLGNAISGFFGAMGGCAMIGQSMINISSGARKRLSGIMASLVLLSFIVFISPLIEMIPLAALVGVMVVVVIKTFGWSSVRIINKIPKSDAFIIVFVSIFTVFYDLATAVLVGVIISALVYVWKSSKHIQAKEVLFNNNQKIYKLKGPLFFGSIFSFLKLFHYKTDPADVVIDFEDSRVWDHSAIEALEKVAMKYQEAGKRIRYKHLSADCVQLLGKMGKIVVSDKETDPHYEVVMDHNYIPGSH